MTAPWIPVVAVVSGWGTAAVSGGGTVAGRLSRGLVLAVTVTGAWLAVLDCAGVPWTPVSVAAVWLPGLFLAGLRAGLAVRGKRCRWRPSPWAVVAGTAVAARVISVVIVPAFGWDFRYIWGLKGRVFAMAGGHDLAWLVRPIHRFSHPVYPPLWPDLLATGVLGGDAVGRSAAVWGALLVVGLGAACWRLARPSGPAIAALAAMAGSWFPTFLAPSISNSGSAEPLAAFLLAAALGELFSPEEGRIRTVMAGLALGGLGTVKQEGMVLVGIVLVVLLGRVPVRRWLLLAGAGLVPIILWEAAILRAGVPGTGRILDPGWAVGRAVALPDVLFHAVTPVLAVEAIIAVIVLVVPPFPGSREIRLGLLLWFGALLAAYLTSPYDLRWHVETSLQRVLAIPLPGLLALVLGSVGGPGTPVEPGPVSGAV